MNKPSHGRLEGLPPVADVRTRLLVLGSFPGAASLAARQYYAHPRNHFWPLLAAIWERPLVDWPYERRLEELRARGVGLWDVHASCRREGSLDTAIEDARPNDLVGLARRLPALAAILHNCGESARVMRVTQALGVPVERLPSTSPANASWSFQRKLDAWRAALARAGVL